MRPLAGGTTTFTRRRLGASTIRHCRCRRRWSAMPLRWRSIEEMSDDEKLARPAFETQDAGLQFGVEEVAYQYEALPDTAIAYETLIIDPTRPAEKRDARPMCCRRRSWTRSSVSAPPGRRPSAAAARPGIERWNSPPNDEGETHHA